MSDSYVRSPDARGDPRNTGVILARNSNILQVISLIGKEIRDEDQPGRRANDIRLERKDKLP